MTRKQVIISAILGFVLISLVINWRAFKSGLVDGWNMMSTEKGK